MPLLVQLILTGMSEGGKDDGGAVVFMDKRKHSIVRKVAVTVPNLAKPLWAQAIGHFAVSDC